MDHHGLMVHTVARRRPSTPPSTRGAGKSCSDSSWRLARRGGAAGWRMRRAWTAVVATLPGGNRAPRAASTPMSAPSSANPLWQAHLERLRRLPARRSPRLSGESGLGGLR